MTRVRYENMPLPKAPFRPDRDTRREDGKIVFQTLSFSLNEDAKRISLVGQSIESYPGLFGDDAIDLMNRLNEGVETHVPPPTMASHLFSRGACARIVGNLWPVVEDEQLAPAVVATLRPTDMWVPTSELNDTSPKVMMRRLEGDLHRAGFTKLKGYLLAQLHAEFDVNRDGYDFHYHLVAGGEMAQAIDKLRAVRRFKPRSRATARSGPAREPARGRVA